jgi:hypothetical protein
MRSEDFLTPSFRGCQEIDDRRDWHRASFETAASQLPQDEGFSYAIKDFLMLRKLRRGRLEARAAAMQPIS